MKKTYETPTIEKVTFEYQDQVVASSCNAFHGQYGPIDGDCEHKETEPLS